MALWALLASLSLGAGNVQADEVKDAPLNLTLPRGAASAPRSGHPNATGGQGERPYGSGYEARGLGSVKADATSAPASAGANARGAQAGLSTPGVQRGGHRGGRAAGSGRR